MLPAPQPLAPSDAEKWLSTTQTLSGWMMWSPLDPQEQGLDTSALSGPGSPMLHGPRSPLRERPAESSGAGSPMGAKQPGSLVEQSSNPPDASQSAAELDSFFTENASRRRSRSNSLNIAVAARKASQGRKGGVHTLMESLAHNMQRSSSEEKSGVALERTATKTLRELKESLDKTSVARGRSKSFLKNLSFESSQGDEGAQPPKLVPSQSDRLAAAQSAKEESKEMLLQLFTEKVEALKTKAEGAPKHLAELLEIEITRLQKDLEEALADLENDPKTLPFFAQSVALYACGSILLDDTKKYQKLGSDTPRRPSRLAEVGELNELEIEELPYQVLKGLPRRLIQISSRNGNAAAISSNGDIYAWGSNQSHQLCQETIEKSEKPVKLPPLRTGRGKKGSHLRQPIQISVGEQHMAAISHQGDLFCWGSDLHGQLGLALGMAKTSRGPQTFAPRQVMIAEAVAKVGGQLPKIKARAVTCGQDWTAVIAEVETTTVGDEKEGAQILEQTTIAHGVLYTFGRNDLGQCGHGVVGAMALPHRVPIPMDLPIIKVACGGFHTLALTLTDKVFAWGYNNCGQLGIGSSGGFVETPAQILELEGLGVNLLAAGTFHSAALLDGAEVYTWGSGEMGQLGLRAEGLTSVPSPMLVVALAATPVASISCGDFHTAATTIKGELWVWGAKDHGRLGVRDPDTASSQSGEDGVKATGKRMLQMVTSQGVEFMGLGQGAQHSGLVQWLPAQVCSGIRAKDMNVLGEELQVTDAQETGLEEKLCLQVACTETQTLVLAIEGPQGDYDTDKRGQVLLDRCHFFEGLALSLRAQRTMAEHYEKPAAKASELGMPIVSSNKRAQVLGEGEEVRLFTRKLSLEVAAAFSSGNSNHALAVSLTRHKADVNQLIIYMAEFPDRVHNIESKLKALRFGQFIRNAESRHAGKGSSILLLHPWIYQESLLRKFGAKAPQSLDSANANTVSVAPSPRFAMGTSSAGGFSESMSAQCEGLPALVAACASAPQVLSTAIQRFEVLEGIPDPSLLSPRDELGQPVETELSVIKKLSVELSTCSTALADMRNWSHFFSNRGNSGRLAQFHDFAMRIWILTLHWTGMKVYGDLGHKAMAGILIIYLMWPFLVVFVPYLIPMYGDWASYTIQTMSYGYVVGAGVSALATLRLLRRDVERHNPRCRISVFRDNFSNRIQLFMLVGQTMQLIALAFAEGVPYDPNGVSRLVEGSDVSIGHRWNAIMLAFLLDFRLLLSHESDQIVGISIMVAVTVLWCVARALPAYLSNKSARYKFFAHNLGPLLTGLLYMPMIARVVRSIGCTYSVSRGYLVQSSSLHLVAFEALNISTCTELSSYAQPSQSVPRFLHSKLLSETAVSPGAWITGRKMSLCGAVPCFELRYGSGLLVPHGVEALIALLCFALYFPSACILEAYEEMPDPKLDIVSAPTFRIEFQILRFGLILGRETQRFANWPTLAISIVVLTIIGYRHLMSAPVSIKWIAEAERLGIALAWWACVSSLASVCFLAYDDPSRSSTVAWLMLVSGWLSLVVIWLFLWPMINQIIGPYMFKGRLKRLLQEESSLMAIAGFTSEKDGALNSKNYQHAVLRGRTGIAQRWWDILGVTAPREELWAPRIRKNASQHARELEQVRRKNQTLFGKFIRVIGTYLGFLFGIKIEQEIDYTTINADDDEALPATEDENKARALEILEEVPKAHWDQSEYLNLSYQHLGSKYQLPELGRVLDKSASHLITLKLAKNQLDTFPCKLEFKELLTLDLSFNQFTSTITLPSAPKLQTLSLFENEIPAQLAALKGLKKYKDLKNLMMRQNPISSGKSITYRQLVGQARPGLKYLDGAPFEAPPPPTPQTWFSTVLGGKRRQVVGPEGYQQQQPGFWAKLMRHSPLTTGRRIPADAKVEAVRDRNPYLIIQGAAETAEDATSHSGLERRVLRVGSSRRRVGGARSQEVGSASGTGWADSSGAEAEALNTSTDQPPEPGDSPMATSRKAPTPDPPMASSEIEEAAP